MSAPILDIRGLRKRFGTRDVLRGVDLCVMPAEHVALVGNNGRGKTTLIRLVLGLLSADSGDIALEGQAVGRFRTPEQKRRIGYLPESVSFYPALTGWQTLRFLGHLKHARYPEAAAGLEDELESLFGRVGLTGAAHRKVREYSKGMRQRLGLAASLLGSPRLLLLDEPTNGLDPDGVHEFYDILSSLQRDGVAILMASHLLSEIEPRLDRLAVLRDGVISRQGTIAELTAEARLPTTVRFSLRDAAPALPPELVRVGAKPVSNGAARSFAVLAAGGATLPILAELVRHAAVVDSVTVQAPGLEDLFRRLNRPAETTDPEATR